MNKLFYGSLLFLFLASAGCKKTKECMYNYPLVAADKYIYPVKPGSAEWNAAGASGIGQSYPLDPIYKLCQIPENILQSMSTLGLIQSLEENPCMVNMLLRDNSKQGRDEVLSRLNVSWILNKRADAGTNIIKYYESKDPNIISCIGVDYDKFLYATNWFFFNMVCTQDSILNQLDSPKKRKFAKIINEKFNTQLQYPKFFEWSKTSSILLMSQLMISDNFQPYLVALQANPNLNFFAETGALVDDFYPIVLNFTNQFIK
ncbi:MAG: hypothetical protein ABJA37_14865 [Ferruginibacter sp.]